MFQDLEQKVYDKEKTWNTYTDCKYKKIQLLYIIIYRHFVEQNPLVFWWRRVYEKKVIGRWCRHASTRAGTAPWTKICKSFSVVMEGTWRHPEDPLGLYIYIFFCKRTQWGSIQLVKTLYSVKPGPILKKKIYLFLPWFAINAKSKNNFQNNSILSIAFQGND